MILRLLTTYPIIAHAIWLRLTAATDIPEIQIGDYLNMTCDTLALSGIVLRRHSDPWRVDVLCHRMEADALTPAFKTLLPEHAVINTKVKVWPAPLAIKPTLLLADDNEGLAAVSLLYAWRKVLPTRLLLWQTQGRLPFALSPSRIHTPALPADMIATMVPIEDLGIVLRMLSDTEKPGCFQGDMVALGVIKPELKFWQILKIVDMCTDNA